jgi:hypothetical protein
MLLTCRLSKASESSMALSFLFNEFKSSYLGIKPPIPLSIEVVVYGRFLPVNG